MTYPHHPAERLIERVLERAEDRLTAEEVADLEEVLLFFEGACIEQLRLTWGDMDRPALARERRRGDRYRAIARIYREAIYRGDGETSCWRCGRDDVPLYWTAEGTTANLCELCRDDLDRFCPDYVEVEEDAD